MEPNAPEPCPNVPASVPESSRVVSNNHSAHQPSSNTTGTNNNISGGGWKRFVRSNWLLVGGAVVVTCGVAGYQFFRWKQARLPSEFVLSVNLSKGIVEQQQGGFPWMKKNSALADLTAAIRMARDDPKCKGLVAKITSPPEDMGFAKIQEIRAAITDFSAGGKPTAVHATTIGPCGPNATMQYYLMSSFQRISVQPSAEVGITGLASSSVFLKTFLDKLKIKSQWEVREEYKNAINIFTESAYSKHHREQTENLLKDLSEQIIKDVAKDRKLPESEVRDALENGPFIVTKALEKKLIDSVEYYDQTREAIAKAAISSYETTSQEKNENKKEKHFLSWNSYQRKKQMQKSSSSKKGDKIGVIYAVGPIMPGEPSRPGNSCHSITMTHIFKRAVQDKKIKAIVLRIDSPGGDYVASDSIWREIQKAVQSGKPVIVSMGNVAASGGYFIAAPATKIVAQPGTITGSIGILSGKFNLSEFFNEYGIKQDSVQMSNNSTISSAFSDWNEKHISYVKSFVDYAYEDFMKRVVEGRKLDIEHVRTKCAKGRVFSGIEAKELGLVDELGGLDVALRLACKEANLSESEAENYVVITEHDNFFSMIVKQAKGGDAEIFLSPQLQTMIREFGDIFGLGKANIGTVSLDAPASVTKIGRKQ